MSFTALIVDDSEIIRSALERALGMTNMSFTHIYHASNGKEALNRLENSWVDVVLTDIHMPEMSGIELVEAMRSRPDLSDTPIVIISTEGSKTRIEELKSKGISGYLRKPFTPEKIRDLLLDALGGSE